MTMIVKVKEILLELLASDYFWEWLTDGIKYIVMAISAGYLFHLGWSWL